jgi:flagellar assembly protein FliH
LSSSLIKSYTVAYKDDRDKKKKRVIDSNQAVSERIRELSEILESTPEEDFADDFNEGLDAEQVDALLADQDVIAEQARQAEKVQKIVDDANEQARQIIEDANEQAAKIIEDAQAQAQQVLEDAKVQGEALGNEKGYAEGLERAAEVEKQAREKAEALDRQYEEKIEELEPLFVEKLTDIYSHVFGIDLAGRNDVIMYLLNSAIRNIEGTKNYLVHVSKDDYEYVSNNREELTTGISDSAVVEIVEDMTLNEGAAFIETDSGIYDCSIGTEMELLKKELKMLSYGN